MKPDPATAVVGTEARRLLSTLIEINREITSILDLDELLKKHKVTIRCIPLSSAAEQGKCFLTGRPSVKRAVFAKAY